MKKCISFLEFFVFSIAPMSLFGMYTVPLERKTSMHSPYTTYRQIFKKEKLENAAQTISSVGGVVSYNHFSPLFTVYSNEESVKNEEDLAFLASFILHVISMMRDVTPKYMGLPYKKPLNFKKLLFDLNIVHEKYPEETLKRIYIYFGPTKVTKGRQFTMSAYRFLQLYKSSVENYKPGAEDVKTLLLYNLKKRMHELAENIHQEIDGCAQLAQKMTTFEQKYRAARTVIKRMLPMFKKFYVYNKRYHKLLQHENDVFFEQNILYIVNEIIKAIKVSPLKTFFLDVQLLARQLVVDDNNQHFARNFKILQEKLKL